MEGYAQVKGPKNRFTLEFNLSQISKENIDLAKPENKGVLIREFYIPGDQVKAKLVSHEFGKTKKDVPIDQVRGM